MDEGVRRQSEAATRVLKEAGATEVYVFGSVVEGDLRPDSDIDFAERGLPARSFFPTMAKMCEVVERPFDLIDLDECKDFADFLMSEGELRRVG